MRQILTKRHARRMFFCPFQIISNNGVAYKKSASEALFCARLAQTLSFLIKPRGILRSKMTKPRGKTLVFLIKPRGMNDFVKPNEQSSSLLEYSAMARNRTFKKGTLYAIFYPEKTLQPFISSAI